jgi:signal transduction histidine kinase
LIARERERAHEREREQAREIERAYTELKATKDRLVQQEKLASLGELTAGIAHEIKNPLNFVNNFAELMGELVEELNDELHSDLDASGAGNSHQLFEILADLKMNAEQIAKHGRRADGIVSAMMQHASGGTGQREPTAVNALVEEYINLAYHGKRAQKEAFTCEIERDYDEAVGAVEMIPQDIGRVVLNLLGNAFDAVSEQKQPKVRVQTQRLKADADHDRSVPSADAIAIRVTDNGPGIHENLREKIFMPFFTTKPTGSGTGLGLSMSHDITVQGHSGTLTVETVEGEGATFIITLPG